jgi:hypothetical protein
LHSVLHASEELRLPSALHNLKVHIFTSLFSCSLPRPLKIAMVTSTRKSEYVTEACDSKWILPRNFAYRPSWLKPASVKSIRWNHCAGSSHSSWALTQATHVIIRVRVREDGLLRTLSWVGNGIKGKRQEVLGALRMEPKKPGIETEIRRG